jgi:putative protease
MFGARSDADRLQSRSLYKEARAIYQREPEAPRVPVDLTFTARHGEGMTLRAVDGGGFEYDATAPAAETAHNRATTATEVGEWLQKTGGTVFRPRDVKVQLDPGLRVPAGAVNAMRRAALDALSAQRRRPPERQTGAWQPGVKRLAFEGKPENIFQFLRFEQLTPEILDKKPALIYLPLAEMARHADVVAGLIRRGQDVAPALPRIIWDSAWPDVLGSLRTLKNAGVTQVLCGNLGQLELLRPLGLSLRGDHTLNIMNSEAMKVLKSLGGMSCTLSFEMNFSQMRDLSQSLDCELLAYGRLPLMITENCVIRRRTGNCTCEGPGAALIDKTARSFPLVPEEPHRTAIYNADKLYLADKLDDLAAAHARWHRLSFTTENNKECAAMVSAYLDGGSAAPKNLTRGLYYRGVE